MLCEIFVIRLYNAAGIFVIIYIVRRILQNIKSTKHLKDLKIKSLRDIHFPF